MIEETNKTDASLEVKEDAGKGQAGVVKRWLFELDAADARESDWRNKGVEALEEYRNERTNSQSDNIFLSNVETLRPALFNSNPKPDCRRRFGSKDQVGRYAAEALEEILSTSMDEYDFYDVIEDVVLDASIQGRGIPRVYYEAKIESKAGEIEGEAVERLGYEYVYCDVVQWDRFRHGPGRRWPDVKWISFDHYLTREELVRKFGEEIGGGIDLETYVDHGKDDDHKEYQDKDVFKKALVTEIWDKEKREVIWISKTEESTPLGVDKDPLGLVNFFPIPKPLIFLKTANSMVPMNELSQYKPKIKELKRIQQRINKITEAIKANGFYDPTLIELAALQKMDDSMFVPLDAESIAKIQDKGIQNFIYFVSIKEYIDALRELYQRRNEIKEEIYELTGISDILRGVGDPREKATTQNIKNEWANLRLSRRQGQVERMIRGTVAIMGEIISELFSPQTIRSMTDIDIPTQAEKQFMALSGASEEELKKPTWEEVFNLLKSDHARTNRIDIETESTIAASAQKDKAAINELLGGISSFVQAIGPAVESGLFPLPAAKSLLITASRRYKFGRHVEESLDEIPDKLPNQPQSQEGQPGQPNQLDPLSQAQNQVNQKRLMNESGRADLDSKRLQFDNSKLEMEMRKFLEEQTALSGGVNAN